MLDVFGLPSKFRGDVQIFRPTVTGTSLVSSQAWHKPRGASMIFILCVGGGGGGGGGFTRTAGSAGGGGGGGACAGFAKLLMPAILTPDMLYIQVGDGGNGGTASGAGANGGISFVRLGKTDAAPSRFLYSNATAAIGGGAGAAGNGGAGGTIPGIAVAETPSSFGIFSAIVGIAGGVGGAQTGAVGTSITAWATLPQSPGAGGAGCTTTNFDGGAQTATALLDMGSQGYYPTGAGGIAKAGTGTGAAIDGSSGETSLTPFFNAGGAGGGSNNSGQAGHGGAGGYGCGGGGGGAGTTGGRGGNGGPGIVVIISW